MSASTTNGDRWWVRRLGERRDAKGWWHSFELPDGRRIDGVHPVAVLRERLDRFPIPSDLRGRRALDIGTWDGWYSFELERRGAEVLAIDNWDNPRFHQMHAMLDSRVEYRQMDMFELTPDRIGRFDFVLFMGVLYHLKHPLLALERVCALTTEMAAVESFVLRDSNCPNENVEQRSVLEFYETDEFGGQTDNWVGPSLSCLLAMCRTAGFARAELRKVAEFGVSVACFRRWGPPAGSAVRRDAPRLDRVEHNTKGGVRFNSRADEYATIWFTCGEEELGLDQVKPQVSGYGVRPIFVGNGKDGSWQANFKLPPGLMDGVHEVTVRVGDGSASNAKTIAVASKTEEPTVSAGSSLEKDKNGLAPKSMNLQNVMSQIHARVRQSGNPEASRSHINPSLPSVSPTLQDSYELTALRGVNQRLYQNRNAVGKLPPSPGTLRARLGGILVRGVQRCLFWYTPQILQFHNDVASALNSLGNLIGSQAERTNNLGRQVQRLRQEFEDETRRVESGEAERIGAMEQEIQKLRREVAHLKLDGARCVPTLDRAAAEPELPNSFQFALQNRFRGPEEETVTKLQVYVDLLKPMLSELPRGRWLDLGCGRGEWLEGASRLGYLALGLDSNPASIVRCREKQLDAEEQDSLAYLRSLGDRTAAVITAFHVVEHWPMAYLLALVSEAERVLQAGGLLIVETPNPANLLMGSTNFWNDPTHHHPIPLKLLEFILEHCGLTVVKRLELNPLPKEQRFAFDEISVVNRLNDYFYGPQDYGIIARR